MRRAEPTAYFQFPPDVYSSVAPYDSQQTDMSPRSFFQRNQVQDVAHSFWHEATDEYLYLLLFQFHRPLVEMARFQIVVIEDTVQYSPVCHLAERIFYRAQIGNFPVLPTESIFIGLSAAAFAETGVADLSLVGEYLSAGLFHGFNGCMAENTCEPLVSLAVVIGTHVEQRMALVVVPADDGVFGGRCCRWFRPGRWLMCHLGIEPAAADDGARFQEFQTACGLHLAADDAGQVIFHRQVVDGIQYALVKDYMQCPAERLRFLPFPVKPDADGNMVQGESTLGRLGGEEQFIVELPLPENLAVLASNLLLAISLPVRHLVCSLQTESKAGR
mgnify:CR=1 FL=1